jgi:hypothetical protein
MTYTTKLAIMALGTMLWWHPQAQSQDSSNTRQFAEPGFSGTQLVNTQTTRVFAARTWQFEIQHRFGFVTLDQGLVQDFLGLDLPAVMRMAVGWSIHDRAYVKIGRTNQLKTYDIEYKWLLAKQTSNYTMPVSIALYQNASVQTEPFPNVPSGALFEDDTTAFVYKPAHRLAYNTQVIISSKIGEKISLTASPILVYRNLVPAYHDNFYMVLSTSARLGLGFNSAVVAEYAHVFNNRSDGFKNPFSLGFEFGTANHVFQVFVSNSNKILETQLYTGPAGDLLLGEFLIGFNLQKNFWRK